MENQKKMSSMLEEMWKFLKFNANVHSFGFESKGKKDHAAKKIE
jgi:hypothetical protein